MLNSIGALPRFLLGLACLLALLGLTAAMWLWLPVRPFASLAAPGDDCKLIRISADGKFLIAVHEWHLTAWDLTSRREVGRCAYQWVANDPALEVIWLAPDGLQVAYIDGKAEPPQVCLWDRSRATAPTRVTRLPDCWGIPATLLASRTMVTHGKGGHRLWDVTTGKEIALPPGSGDIRVVQYLARCGQLVGFEEETKEGWLVEPRQLVVWTDLAGRAEKKIIPGARLPAEASPDGRLLAVTTGGQTCLYDLPTGTFRAALPRWEGDVPSTQLAFSPDSRLLVTPGPAGLALWLEPTRRTPGSGSRPRPVMPSLDGRFAVWDVSAAPPRPLATIEVPEVTSPPMFLPNGQGAAVWERPPLTSQGRTPGQWGLRLLETQSWQDCGAIPAELMANTAFAPDSRTVAGQVWGEEQPPLLYRWLRPAQTLSPVRGTKVWDIATTQEVALLRDTVCFAYLPDGQHIAVGHNDGRIALWDIPPRRSGWVDYGLPTAFAILLLAGVRFVWRSWRWPAPAEAEPVAADTMPA